MPYSGIKYFQLIDALAARLSDPDHAFWSENELKSYLTEALRTNQVFTSIYNKRVTIPTAPNTLFYDLFSLVPELAPSVTDEEVMRDIAFALQEPYIVGTGTWVGTQQFTASSVLQAIQYRRDKFFLETGLVLQNSEVSGPTPTTPSIGLAQSVMDVRNALWKDLDGNYSLMWRTDQFILNSVPSTQLTPGIPENFYTYPLQPLIMEVAPTPLDIGQINLLTTNTGATLTLGSPQILGVPDDLCWVIKFGALADLFAQDGPGQDDARATYCESRWRDGITLSRITNFVHTGQNNGIPWYIDSLAQMNTGDPTWITRASGTPEVLALSGNMACVGPVADGVYSLTFDIMPKMIIPPSPTSYVQVGPETIDILLDYAQHLANVKEGVKELTNSQRQYENMVRFAAIQNDKLRAAAQNFDVMSDRSNVEKKFNIRRVSNLTLKEINYNAKS